MLAKEFISDIVPALRTSDTGIKALAYMDIFRISHLPIVNNSEFLGLISDKDIFDLNMADEPIGNHALSLTRPFVLANQHAYEIIEIFSRLSLSLVPVLDEKNNYLGIVTQYDLLKQMATLFAVNEPGAIIVLEMNINDYTLSQISQIVESNNAKILSTYVSPHPDSTQIDVTLKINKTDLTSIVQTFIRYNYQIKASFLNNNIMDELLDERFELFMKYLNI